MLQGFSGVGFSKLTLHFSVICNLGGVFGWGGGLKIILSTSECCLISTWVWGNFCVLDSILAILKSLIYPLKKTHLESVRLHTASKITVTLTLFFHCTSSLFTSSQFPQNSPSLGCSACSRTLCAFCTSACSTLLC